MFIKKLILFKNKRFHLLEDETIEFIAEKDQVIIRGVSGRGKSTFLEELSPLPAFMRDYQEGGYKEIHIEHLGKNYLLRSEGSKAGEHSFMVEREELNTGRTLTVQQALVKEHFNYTPAIHEVLLGKKTFTQMNGTERRKWFNEMSNSDNDFVMKFWNTLASSQRDNTGALKNTKSKLVEHNSQLAKPEEVEKHQQELKRLESILNGLNQLRGKWMDMDSLTQSWEDEKEAQVLSLIEQVIEQGTQNHSEQWDYNLKVGLTMEDIQEQQKKTGHMLGILNTEITNATDELASIQTEKQKYVHQEDMSIEEIQSHIEKANALIEQVRNEDGLVDYIDELLNSIPLDSLKERIERISDSADRGEIEELLGWINEYNGSDETRSYAEIKPLYEEGSKNITVNEGKLSLLESRQQSDREHLQSLLQEPSHQCPKCNTTFKENTVNEKIAKLNEVIAKRGELIHQLEGKLTSDREEVEKLKSRCILYAKIHRFLFDESHPVHFLIRKEVLGNSFEEEFKNHVKIPHINAIERILYLIRHITIPLKYIALKCDLNALNAMIEKQEAKQGKDYLLLISKETALNERLEELRSSQEKLKEKMVELKSHEVYALSILENQRKIKENYDRLISLLDIHDKLLYEETIGELMGSFTERMEKLNKYLQHQSGLTYILDHLNGNQKNIEHSLEVHNLLMKLLSPKDGLIAQSAMGFIRKYIQEMNDLIRCVWTYNLSIDIETEEDFTKDYKFPVSIGEDGFSQDVSQTSLGQSEIINVCFKILMMKYCKLEQWPFYSDEIGAALNQEYRNNFFNLIKRLQNEGKINQLFVITHLNDVENMMPYAQSMKF